MSRLRSVMLLERFLVTRKWICFLYVALMSLNMTCDEDITNTYIINNQYASDLEIFIRSNHEQTTELNDKEFILTPFKSKVFVSIDWNRPIKPSEQFEYVYAKLYSNSLYDTVIVNLSEDSLWSRAIHNNNRSIDWIINITDDILNEK